MKLSDEELKTIKIVNYYVYEHYLDDELFYIGKGTKDRCLNFKSRSEKWKGIVADRTDDVIVKIVKTFKYEKQALNFEKQRIKQLSKINKLANEMYNLSNKKYNKKSKIKRYRYNKFKKKKKKTKRRKSPGSESMRKIKIIERLEKIIIMLSQWDENVQD